MAYRIWNCFVLAGLTFGCVETTEVLDGGGSGSGGATHSGGATARGGSAGAVGNPGGTGGAAAATGSGFWTQTARVAASQSPRRLLVLSEAVWVVRFGPPGELESTWITRDSGQTYVRVVSGYDDTTRRDVVFYVVGVGSDGRLVAVWQHQDVCDTCAGKPSGPGSPGDAFLLAYDLGAQRWDVVDALPIAALDSRDAVASAEQLWLFGSTIQRFDGPGEWVEVARPAGHTGAFNNVAATREGTLYMLGGMQVFTLSPGQEWQALPMPIFVGNFLENGDALAVDQLGRLYVTYDGADQLRIVRRDGDAWTDVSPPVGATPEPSEPGARAVYWGYQLTAALDGYVAAATVLYDGGRPSGSRYDPIRVFLSRDAGNTWVERSDGLPAYAPEAIAFDPDGRPYLEASMGSDWVWRGLPPSEW